MILYQWRLVLNGKPTSWTDVEGDHFSHLQKNRFFGPGSADKAFFEGRIIRIHSAEITMVPDKEA